MRALAWIPLGLVMSVCLISGCGQKDEAEIEFRYAKVEKGELVRSISATGQVVALTQVDVKSLAGGQILRVAVEEGTRVKKGDLIAVIDPNDTRTIFEQTRSDLDSANARAEQARQNLELQTEQNLVDVSDAEAGLQAARIRAARAQLELKRQPELARTALRTSEARLRQAEVNLDRFEKVTSLQLRREANANVDQSKTNLDVARVNLKRQQDLFAKGYVSQFVVDQATNTAEQANTNFQIQQQRLSTVETDLGAQRNSLRAALDEARAARDQARANLLNIDITRRSYEEAIAAVTSAKAALLRAKTNKIQNEVRRNEVLAASAATVRSRLSNDNAKVQLDQTTVLAPRDGVVTTKYLEAGAIVPPGAGAFTEGNKIVQLSDVTQLYVDCAVDEADIANVRPGQKVRITADAFRGVTVDGVVARVSPAAITANNVTSVKVRVRVIPNQKLQLLPGMNATCEFLTLDLKDTLRIPNQALKDGNKVRIKSSDPMKPTEKTIEVGELGNDFVQVKSGLSVGDEVVTAEINLKELRDAQKKMQEAQEGGGLVGGAPRGPGSRAGGGGGARSGAGGGGRPK